LDNRGYGASVAKGANKASVEKVDIQVGPATRVNRAFKAKKVKKEIKAMQAKKVKTAKRVKQVSKAQRASVAKRVKQVRKALAEIVEKLGLVVSKGRKVIKAIEARLDYEVKTAKTEKTVRKVKRDEWGRRD
jgi:seryl-tRNA synthetase